MSFVPNTEDEQKAMLDDIGVDSFDVLIDNIPQEIRFNGALDLPEPLSEYEIVKLVKSYTQENITASTHICFMGGGAYDRFIPSIVNNVLSKPEFKTAYTPYQAEVSQGTLQAMYEYQSMVCALTGMDVANASMYDGASALAEACLMSHAQNKKKEFLVAGTINPNYSEVLKTYCRGRDLKFTNVIADDGTCDLETLENSINENVSAVIVQQPNFYGNLEDVIKIEKIAHDNKLMFIVSADPISLGILKTPGEYNADIVVGEGQSLGIPLNFGGPYLGLFATKQKFVRKLPGRLSGVTQDIEGTRGFVLTLQTREQQIKREKATSNICSNQGLNMLAATVYLETMGRQGIKDVSEQSYKKAHYLASKIQEIPGFSLANNKPFFNEFLVKTDVPVSKIIEEGEIAGFLSGIDTNNLDVSNKGLLIAVTEKRNKKELDDFVEFLSKIK